MTNEIAVRIRSNLERLPNKEMYVVFCLMSEYGFTFQDFQSLTIEGVQMLGKVCLLSTRNWTRTTNVSRLGLRRQLMTRCQGLINQGEPMNSPMFPNDKKAGLLIPGFLTLAQFRYILRKIEAQTNCKFSRKEVQIYYQRNFISDLFDAWVTPGSVGRPTTMEFLALKLDIDKSTLYRIINGTHRLKIKFDSIKKGKFLSAAALKNLNSSSNILTEIEIKQIENDFEKKRNRKV